MWPIHLECGVCVVYISAPSISQFHLVSSDRMISEQRIGKRVELCGGIGPVLGGFLGLSGGNEENNEKCQSG
jgi:hypothetical protein